MVHTALGILQYSQTRDEDESLFSAQRLAEMVECGEKGTDRWRQCGEYWSEFHGRSDQAFEKEIVCLKMIAAWSCYLQYAAHYQQLRQMLVKVTSPVRTLTDGSVGIGISN